MGCPKRQSSQLKDSPLVSLSNILRQLYCFPLLLAILWSPHKVNLTYFQSLDSHHRLSDTTLSTYAQYVILASHWMPSCSLLHLEIELLLLQFWHFLDSFQFWWSQEWTYSQQRKTWYLHFWHGMANLSSLFLQSHSISLLYGQENSHTICGLVLEIYQYIFILLSSLLGNLEGGLIWLGHWRKRLKT